MLPKTATENLAEVKARRAEMDCKLEEAQHKVDREEVERECKEHEKNEHKEQVKHDEEATKAKKKAEEAEAV